MVIRTARATAFTALLWSLFVGGHTLLTGVPARRVSL
ncbi:hypothetical protein P3T39_006963 [Kitasatospora sp. GP82]|nr:hypothetical protein [Kitasatospora sp. GP82]